MPAADAAEASRPAAIEALFRRWSGEGTIALAVSGGADSLALMLLADRWRRMSPSAPRLVVLSVDHGLRAEAASEVAAVGAMAARLGLSFRALRVAAPLPNADIEAAARDARYGLLAAAARDAGAALVMTAHHADDQAETLLLRLARGSGVYGLAAMAVETELHGIRVARPLLGLGRSELRAVVAEAGFAPVIDPHNTDPRFARSRLRALMPALAREGLDTATLTATTARMRRAASAIDDYADRLIAAAVTTDTTGAVRLDAALWRSEPEETRLRVLARIIRAAGGAAHGPRLDGLVGLAEAMVAESALPSGRTLGGVIVDRRKGMIRFQRELGREGLPHGVVEGGFSGLWDGRFAIEATLDGPAELGALGDAGRRALAVCLPDGLPRAMAATPALRRDGVVVAAPALGVMPAPGSGIVVAMREIVGRRLHDRVAGDDS